MNQQTADQLNILAEITEFAKHYAFSDSEELTPAEFIADQFLRRVIELAEDLSHIISNGHHLNATILQRAISERLAILGYLRQHNQFEEFQNYSMANEYLTLQHITSEIRIGSDTRKHAEIRKTEIRRSMNGEPDKPKKYWRRPHYRDALQDVVENHPNANMTRIIGYEIPSSAIHYRHNDMEPTGISTQVIVSQAAHNTAAIMLLTLVIAEKEDSLLKLEPLIRKLFPEDTE